MVFQRNPFLHSLFEVIKTSCLKPLKQTIKVELIRFSHLLIHMDKLLVGKEDVVFFKKISKH